MQRSPLWLWAGPVAAAAVLAAIGYGPTCAAAGRNGLLGMFAALGIVLAVVYGTLARIVRRVEAVSASQRLQVVLRAGVLRFFVTLLLCVVLVWRLQWPPEPFLVWVAISYIIIVQVETLSLVRWMGTLET